MGRFTVIDAINDPGTPGKTGDDRFGHDGSAGTAWVLDGATDVTPIRPFPHAESGAAWVADAISSRLMQAPSPGEAATAYWTQVLTDVRQRAERETTLPLDSLPPEALPIASGIWLQRTDTAVAFAWMGDCMALNLASGAIIGHVESVAEETADSEAQQHLRKDEQWEAARLARVATNTSDRPIFGLQPEKTAGLSQASEPAAEGDEWVLMSDGFYRLIEPYHIHDARGLATAIRSDGLSGALAQLRSFERSNASGDIARIKPSDDSCALWVRF